VDDGEYHLHTKGINEAKTLPIYNDIFFEVDKMGKLEKAQQKIFTPKRRCRLF
jgi:hypothetical protein